MLAPAPAPLPPALPAIFPAGPGAALPPGARIAPARKPCCACSPRGISTPPQKRMGQLSDGAGVGAPAGSVLSYTATWGNNFLGWNDPNGIQAKIQEILSSKWGIVIDSQSHTTSDVINFSGKSGFTLLLHNTSDYGVPADIQSIIDGELYNTGVQQLSSSIRVVKSVTAPGVPVQPSPDVTSAIATAQAGYQDALARGDSTTANAYATQIRQLGGTDPRGTVGWLSDNWMWLAAAGVGLVAAKELL